MFSIVLQLFLRQLSCVVIQLAYLPLSSSIICKYSLGLLRALLPQGRRFYNIFSWSISFYELLAICCLSGGGGHLGDTACLIR